MIIPAEVEDEGCIVITGRHLTDLVRRLPDGNLTLQLKDDTATVRNFIRNRLGERMQHLGGIRFSDSTATAGREKNYL